MAIETTTKKLDFFLHLALMDQQLGLVLYSSSRELDHVRDFVARSRDYEKIQEIDSLEAFCMSRGACVNLFHLNEKNEHQVTEAIARTYFPAFVRALFTLSLEEFNSLPEDRQEKILSTFNPIYRGDL
ncbi:MAG: hypothetical protein UW70_C0090G0008 [Candidatus Peregrinibacteria bacterium GW2011_GWA2_44_7]|nr:MAG: hypothetical protein UW70_C0090G0008 [Candidatus Peregrinibacteria bacterium GW2011_GWA2_44_7]